MDEVNVRFFQCEGNINCLKSSKIFVSVMFKDDDHIILRMY